MRYSVYILPIMFLFACSQENENNDAATDSLPSDSNVIVEDDMEEVPEEVVEDLPGNTPFFMDDFPKVWLQLSPDEENSEEYVIYHYCEAEVPSIQFTPKKGDVWSVYIGFGQDGNIYEVSNFEAYEIEKELYQCVEGTFDMISEYSSEKKFVSFLWNRDLFFSSFEGLGFDQSLFVCEEERGNYAEVNEDCTGLWE